MHKEMRNALLQMYKNLDEAKVRQEERGGHDQGARSQVTGGKHMNSVAKIIRTDLISAGYAPDKVYYEDGCLRLPGWFRPSKDWDLMAFDDDDLLAVVELKSINSSFGNNSNNRAEESIGSAVDASYAIKNNLIPFKTTPPIMGYVLVVKICDSSIKSGNVAQRSLYPIDPVFDRASYLKRLSVMCRRLLSERLYQAVWIVGVDPENEEVIEPENDLTYDKFITVLSSQLAIHRA